MILAIDSGNTRTKWGVFNAVGELVSEGFMMNTQLADAVHENKAQADQIPSQWQSCKRAVIANVAGEKNSANITAILDQLNLECLWVESSHHSCGVENTYAKPTQLGIDRWASLIAAWKLKGRACVVISAGTALTIDTLIPNSQGGATFTGGLIIPGLDLMQNSLMTGTADLAHKSQDTIVSESINFPINTADAIKQGAMRAMVGAVLTVYHQLSTDLGHAPECVLTGGNRSELAQGLRIFGGIVNNVAVVPHLVLQGLFELESESE